MLSQALKSRAMAAWQEERPHLCETGIRLQKVLEGLEGDLAAVAALLFATLPALDLVQTPVEVLLSYARHGLMLRQESPFCREVPEDIFIHDVLYPRINTEALTDCRPFFHGLVEQQVRGLPVVEAALAVNLWCARHMTYESTDDRTLDPMAAYHCGKGRCGEESTFAVSVLRAVGIPARQVYAIWWNHCDDNHAWVEFYDGSRWRYFGACEPEPVPDRGWFTAAAGRATAICSRRFWEYRETGPEQEEVLGIQGCCILDNQTGRYTKTRLLQVQFPEAGGKLRVYGLNMAGFRLLTELPANPEHTVTLHLGRGTCLLEAELHGLFDWKVLEPEGTLVWEPSPRWVTPPEGRWDMDFQAAPACGGNAPLTGEETERKNRWLALAQAHRKLRHAETTAPGTGVPQWDSLLEQAGENGKALLAFAQTYGDPGWNLLGQLTKKDWRDARPEVLERFLLEAPGIAPRLAHEKLVYWPDAIKNRFPGRKEPELLWQELRECAGSCRVYPALWPDPVSAVTLGMGDGRSRTVAFAAALRVRGIPAEVDTGENRVRWYRDGTWHTAGAGKTALLTLPGSGTLTQGLVWSLSRWEGRWQELKLIPNPEECYTLPCGLYLLTVTTRLPNGNQLARFRVFPLENAMEIPLSRRVATGKQMLTRYPISLSRPGQGIRLRLYLETGTEPTEHVLNELLESAHLLGMGENLEFVLPETSRASHPTLKKVFAAFPHASQMTGDFGDPELEAMVRALYQEPGVWPLLLLTDGKTGFYSYSGYAVGAVPLALELLELLRRQTTGED